ncbi:MAG TPA: hypothetical protein GX729_07225 [Firmicutes bacterium]|nr:hypothetical protein [Bacillota bacterium]
MKISGGNVSRGLHNDLQWAHAGRRMKERSFVVVAMKKDGDPYSIKTANPQLDYFSAMEAAEKRAQYLERMNPGRTFTVISN